MANCVLTIPFFPLCDGPTLSSRVPPNAHPHGADRGICNREGRKENPNSLCVLPSLFAPLLRNLHLSHQNHFPRLCILSRYEPVHIDTA